MALVFDIETIGIDFDSLDDVTQQSLTRWIKREAGEDQGKYNVLLTDLKENLGFSPVTGEIVALGIMDTAKKEGVIYFQSGEEKIEEFKKDNFSYKPRTEAQMLKDFWQGARQYNEFVSFNGRSFDVPFLMVRSAVHRIKPTVNLMSNRYLNYQYTGAKHIDLLDQFTFYGAVRRKGNLHLYCNAFNIKSPKDRGITGDDVEKLFREKKYKQIAEYNSWDVVSTTELYYIWYNYINI